MREVSLPNRVVQSQRRYCTWYWGNTVKEQRSLKTLGYFCSVELWHLRGRICDRGTSQAQPQKAQRKMDLKLNTCGTLQAMNLNADPGCVGELCCIYCTSFCGHEKQSHLLLSGSESSWILNRFLQSTVWQSRSQRKMITTQKTNTSTTFEGLLWKKQMKAGGGWQNSEWNREVVGWL